MEELYEFFAKGMRFYFWRRTGPQDPEDLLHDLFIVVVEAIRQGDIREPERLMGFVQTIARRQVCGYIRQVTRARADQMPVDAGDDLTAASYGPEQVAALRECCGMVNRVLGELSCRDREILTRFYLLEQDRATICREMDLTKTQFRLLKSRAKARFGERGKRKLRRPLTVCESSQAQHR